MEWMVHVNIRFVGGYDNLKVVSLEEGISGRLRSFTGFILWIPNEKMDVIFSSCISKFLCVVYLRYI